MFEEPTERRARPVIGWPGGKGRLLKWLLPHVPPHSLYVEVFGGGLAVFLGKEPSELEVINDINGDLVCFYKQVKYHLDPLLDELDLVLNSRELFHAYLEQKGLTEIQRAARWFIKNKLSFGGLGRHFGTSKKTATASMGSRNQRLLAIRALNRRLDRTCIEQLPWEKCIDSYDTEGAFFFFDPPYLDAGGSAYSGWSEHELARFCSRIKKLQGKFLFTFQDCPQVRDHMAGHHIEAIVRANGIGNRSGKSGRVYREVAITSAPAAAGRARKGAAS